MAGFNDGTISIDIVPDGDGFQLKLDKILNATSGSVELKPDVAKLASNVKKAAKLIPAIEIKATIDPNLTKGSLSGLKTKVEQALGGFSDKVGNSTYKIRPNVELDVRFTETSLKKLKGSVNGAFRNVETSAESGTRKITASANIGVKFTETSLRGLKRDVKNVFKKEQVDLATGKKIKVVAPIDIKAELDFSQNKANKFRTDVRRKISGVTGDGTKGQKYNIKLGSELSVPSAANIRLTKSILLEKFGVVKLPVVTVGRTLAINNAGAGVASAAVNSGTAKSIAINGAAAKSVKGLADANSGLNGTLRSIGQAQQASRGSFTSFIGGVNLAKVAAIGLGAAVARVGSTFVKFALDSSKEAQNVRRAFQGFIGDGQRVSKLFEELQDFAAVTPFDFEGLLKSSRTLLGAGFKPEELIGSLSDIAGVGAQLGASTVQIERVTTALAKIKGQGKVTQREIRSIFTAFPGFQPIKALADEIPRFGGNTSKALKAITASGVTADEAVDALLKGMAKFPGAANALYTQSLTLAGSQDTLLDRFQQVARAAADPALNTLAKNYRDAAEIFDQQSKSGTDTSGITGLLSSFGKGLPVLANVAIPVLNSFAKALTPIVDTLVDFAAAGGAETFLEVFKAGVNVLPAFNTGLNLALNLVKPFLPTINALSAGLGSIPPQLLAIVGGLKLLGSGGGSGGIIGRILGGKMGEDGQRQGNFLKRTLSDASQGVDRLGVSAKKAFAAPVVAGLKSYNREIDTLKYSQVSLSQGFSSGQISARDFNKEMANVSGQIGAVQRRGVTFGATIKESFNNAKGAVTSFAKSAASSVKSFGIELAIGLLIGGITHYINKAAEARKVTQNIAKDAELIGEKLRFDTSAVSGSIAEINLLESVITDSEEGAKAFKFLDTGKKKTGVSKKTTDAFLKKYQKSDGTFNTSKSVDDQSGLYRNGGDKQVKFSKTFDENVKRIDNARKIIGGDDGLIKKAITGSDKEFDKVIKDLNLAGQVARDSRLNDFGAVGPENTAKNLKTLRKQYKDAYKDILDQNIKASKENGDKTTAAFLKEVKTRFEKTGDVAKAYEESVNAISKNAIDNAGLRKNLRDVRNGLITGADAQDILNKAQAQGGDIASEYASTLAELSVTVAGLGGGVGEASFDTVQAALGSNFTGLYRQVFNEVQTNPSGAGALVDKIASSLGLDEAGAKEFAKKIASFKADLMDKIRETADDIGKALPAIADAFNKDFKFDVGGIGARELNENLDTYVTGVKNFATNINKLAQQFPDLAEKIASMGPGAGSKMASDLANNPGLAEKTRKNLMEADAIYAEYVEQQKGIIQRNFENLNGFSPGELGAPVFSVTAPSQAEIDTAAARLAEIATAIKTKRDELLAKNKILKRFGEKTVNVDAAIGDNPLYTEVLAEQAKLQAFLDGAKKQIFADLETQATTTATAINTSFSDAKIDVAIQPQVDNAAKELSAIPQKIKDTFGADFKANSVLALTGNSIGKGFVDGIKVGLDAQLLLVSEPIRVQFRTLGQQIAESIAYGFGVGNDAITNAIKKPFNDASTPLNSFFGTLVAASKAVGISASFAPIPQFHTGGIAGEKAVTHNGRFTRDEMLAVVKKKEGILPETSMKKLGKARFEMLRRGEFGDGPGINGEALANYSTDKDRVAINQAKDNYFSRYRKTDISGPLNKRMADKIVESYAFASLKKLDEIQAKVDAANINGANVPGVISSGEVYNSLLAAKGKFGSFITLIKAMRGTGMPFGVSSTVRPGAITASGNRSLHGVARAVDFTGTGPQMLKMARWWAQYGPVLAELIHTPMGFGYKNGKKVSSFGSVVDKGHYNHGHVALFRGGLVKGSSGGIMANIGERGQSEAVLPLGQPDRMASIISHAIRSGEMSESGQRAIANVIGQGQTTNHNVTNQEVTVNVVAPVKDAELQGTIIQHRVSAALKGM